MTHWTERISEYLDNDLTPVDRSACEAHLAGCEMCRTLADELREVTSIARNDADRPPAADLWPGVLSRIAADGVGPRMLSGVVDIASARGTVASTRRARQIVFTLPQLALAASLLIAVSAGVAYVAAGRATSVPAVREYPIQAQADGLLPSSVTVERANFADAQYDQAVSDLENVLVARRDELDPRTVMVIERNLGAIDRAIQEAREALDADPANMFLNSHLADARRKKLELLRRATMLQYPSGD